MKYYFSDGTISDKYDSSKLLHSEDNFMAEYGNIVKFWYDGKIKRLNGYPLEEYSFTAKYWCTDDDLHRIDGPAAELADGRNLWYVDGIKYNTEQEFNKFIEDIKALDPILQLTDSRQWVRELIKSSGDKL